MNAGKAITAALQDQRRRDWSWLSELKWPLRLRGGIADGRVAMIVGAQPLRVEVPELLRDGTIRKHQYDARTGVFVPIDSKENP